MKEMTMEMMRISAKESAIQSAKKMREMVTKGKVINDSNRIMMIRNIVEKGGLTAAKEREMREKGL